MSCLPPSEMSSALVELSRGFSADSPAWATACFGNVRGLKCARIGSAGAKSLPCPSSSETALTSCKASGRRDRVAAQTSRLPLPAQLQIPPLSPQALGTCPFPLPPTKVCSEHQPPSNLPPASPAPLGRSKAPGSCAATSVVGAEHFWKGGGCPSSQGGTCEDQPLPGRHVHLLMPKPSSRFLREPQRAPAPIAASFSTLAADGLHMAGWRVVIWVATAQQGRRLGPWMQGVTCRSPVP